jgi:hypothetical protein
MSTAQEARHTTPTARTTHKAAAAANRAVARGSAHRRPRKRCKPAHPMRACPVSDSRGARAPLPAFRAGIAASESSRRAAWGVRVGPCAAEACARLAAAKQRLRRRHRCPGRPGPAVCHRCALVPTKGSAGQNRQVPRRWRHRAGLSALRQRTRPAQGLTACLRVWATRAALPSRGRLGAMGAPGIRVSAQKQARNTGH